MKIFSRATLSEICRSLQVLLALFDKCDRDHTGELDDHQMAALNAHLFYMVPRLGHKSQGMTKFENQLIADFYKMCLL